MQQISRLALTFLLNAVWQIAFIAAGAWLCSRVIRHAPARFIHRLWVGALLLGLLLPLWSTIRAWPVSESRGAWTATGPGSLVQPRSSLLFFLRIPESISVAPFWIDACAALYFVLLLWRALWMVRSWLATERLRTTARPFDPPPRVAAIAARSCSAFGISPVSLHSSSLARSPLTLGFFRRKIVVPDAVWKTAGDDEWASILSHEMAHIQRGDLVKNLVYEFLRWPIFFHPAAVLMKRQIGRTRELACDEMATERFVDSAIYARALIDLAGMTSGLPRPLPSNYSLAVSDPSILEERIMRLLHRHGSFCRQPRTLLALALAMLVALSLTVAAFAVVVRQAPAHMAPPAAKNALGSPVQANKVLTLDEGITPPHPISTPEPEYPQAERKANKEGSVTLSIVVGTDGNVHDWQVLSSSAKDFEDESISAVRHWTFEPGQKDGQPVSVELRIEVEFRLSMDKPKTD